MSSVHEKEHSPAEVESAQMATEITLLWGDSEVLHVAHLSSPRSFYIGETESDYLIGSEVLGVSRIPIMVATFDGMAIVIPEGADGVVSVSERTTSLRELDAEGKLASSAEMPSAKQYVLPRFAVASVTHRGLTWTVRSTYAAKKIGVGDVPVVRLDRHAWTLLSLSVHAAVLAMFYLMPPSSSALSLDLVDSPSRLVQVMLAAEAMQEPEPLRSEDAASGGESTAGERAAGDEGAMGDEASTPTRNRYGVRGPEENPNPQLAHERARESAAVAGAIGVLQAMTGAWDSPTSPYGADVALGADRESALGALTGDQIGTNHGFGGLGLRGPGRGAGGHGEGTIGVGGLATIGGVPGGGSGPPYGRGTGGFRGRGGRVPVLHTGNAEVRGSLSHEVIRRTIRRHINEVRFCYERELAQRPDLAGRVTVSFIIGSTGSVTTATTTNTTLQNARVEGCLAQAVRRWTFPAPDGGGVVGVNYPFVFDTSGS